MQASNPLNSELVPATRLAELTRACRYPGGMPELDFALHTWPGYPAPVVAGAVRHAATSAGGSAGVSAVRVMAKGPFAARVSVGVTANVSGVVAGAVEAALERLRDPARPRED